MVRWKAHAHQNVSDTPFALMHIMVDLSAETADRGRHDHVLCRLKVGDIEK